MKKTIRSFLALLLATVICLSLASCGGDDTPVKETEGSTEEITTAPPDDGMLKLVDEGSARYRIVYPLLGNVCISDAYTYLKSTVSGILGVNMKSIADNMASKGDQLPEILLGGTTYEESVAAIDALPENSFSVTVSGDRVVIAATNDSLYRTAVEHFLSACTVEDGSLVLPDDYSYTSESYPSYTLVTEGKSEYVIVYDNKTSGALEAAETLQKSIIEATGVSLTVKRDAASVASGKEILIGNTDRALSASSVSYFMDYTIARGENGSIAITGVLDSAVAYLGKLAMALGKEGELAVLDNTFAVRAADGYGTIPAFRETAYDYLYKADHNSYYVLYDDATMDECKAYLQTLPDKGFAEYTKREVNGNLFATYTDGNTVLTVTFIKFRSYVRIAAETMENTSLPALKSDMEKAVTTPQLTQINGACSFLLRLSDGRFIVMDGGMNYERNVETLYAQLNEQNVLEGKPVIAAWFLSHAHSDHFGCFIGFSEKYSKKVELQTMVWNIPSYEVYSRNTEASDVTPGMVNKIAEAKTALEKYTGTKTIVTHSGQQMWFGDAMIDMLYTHEDLSPSVMTVTNSSSLIYAVSIAGQRIVITNDGHDDACLIVNRMYGDTLKSDIVQIAHHGYNGGNDAMYRNIKADTALWTNPYEIIVQNTLWNNPRNHFDINSVKENLMMSDNSVMIIPLPHTVGSLPAFARTFS